jgi:hypothetical protein
VSAEQDGDLWLRLRFQRHRLPREDPDLVTPENMLKQALKVLGRRFGYAVEEIHEVGADPATLALPPCTMEQAAQRPDQKQAVGSGSDE